MAPSFFAWSTLLKKGEFPLRIGLLSPGSLPLPPARCTSVEIYAAHLARELSRHHLVTLYAHGAKRGVRVRGGLTTRKWKTRGGTPYVRLVVGDVHKNTPSILQIENRIPFVLPLKQAFPRVPLVLNLHSNVLIQGLPRKRVDRSLKRVDALVVNSNYLKRFLLSRYPVLREHQVHVIHPGIDLDHFPPRFSSTGKRLRAKTRARLGVGEDKKVLLYVGRFIPRKGIGELLEAFADVHPRHPDAELWIIGGKPNGQGDFHQEMRGKAAGLPVRFLGFIRQDKLPAYYAASDLLVCPSQKAEAFGMVNLEASAAGLAVVASADWGIREAVKHGVSGVLVDDYRRPAAFAEAICNLLDDPLQLDRLGRSGHLWVREHFSWSRTAEHFLALYRKLT